MLRRVRRGQSVRDRRMMLVATKKADQSLAILDPWSVVHGATGLALGLLGTRLSTALALAIVYELVEGRLQADPSVRSFWNVSRPESFANQVADVLVLGAGVIAGHRYNATAKRSPLSD